MTHPLVDQFRFTRSEWLRGLEGVSEKDAAEHFGQMNCISWTVGHLAWHEHRTWLERAQNIILFPELNKAYGFGCPMSTPSLAEVLKIWHQVIEATDLFLNTLTTQILQGDLLLHEKPVGQTIGSALAKDHLPLLVPYRRGSSHTPDAGTKRSAGFCRGYRP